MKLHLDKFLVVGLGSAGKRHARLLNKLSPNALIGILTKSQNEKFFIGSNFIYLSDVNEALEFNPKLICIANPSSFHIETANKFLKKGVHIFIEKPLSHSINGVREFIVRCNAEGVKVSVGYNLRFFDALINFKKLIKGGCCGKLLSFRVEVGQNIKTWRPNMDYRSSVSVSKKLGGGVLLELSHELDYIHWIFGKVHAVSAWVGRQDNLAVDVEDSVHAIMSFDADASGHQLVGTLSMDFLRHDKTRGCEVVGSSGTLRFCGISGKVDFFGVGMNQWKTLFNSERGIEGTYELQLINILNDLQDNNLIGASVEDGLNVLELIGAIRSSSLSGKKVILK